ncbi:MAG: DUF202 domain-containing protein [Alphaproteobacteria bacterium]|nr:MAG: DUF202 domain-containing protein [Alphaproteobacteria bacterium]
MIDHFSDLSANERTWLAWVRTVLAIAGFGLLIDRLSPPGTTRGWFAPALIALSAALLLAVTVRFYVTRRMIRDNSDDSERFVSAEGLLAGVVVLLMLVIFVFLAGLV